ncbi:ABC transporter permease [Yinghuangia sp. ASG 101]|uniref:ABC transporter permease n=1 Tax=Yinghuangia sp. ASG 101 TaxID=2896848 RepID=UPI001E5B3B57|nr:ABC transporter permease [Yinghuangia sp. ASG 101]UGQ12396.1 ABC transporter permease [Yinghuangia sp. ASG 101]
MLTFLLRRTLGALAALAVLSVLLFAATEVLPGDAGDVVAGVDASPGERARIRHELGLDRSAARRYADWASHAVRGDFGTAMVGGRPVADVIADRLPNSALLAGLALVLSAPVVLALGLVAGMRPGGRLDRVISTLSQGAVGTPDFVVGALLVAVFAGWWGLLPRVSLVPLGESPLSSPEVLVLPVLTLCVAGPAAAVRIIRAAAAEVAATPYIENARLNGVRGTRLALRHFLPGTAAPAIQAPAMTAAGLVGGTVVVETVFAYPGIGLEMRQAVAARDVPMVQGIALTLSAITLAVLLIADVACRVLDPRKRP